MTNKLQNQKNMQFTRKKIESYSYGLVDQIGKGYSSKVYRGRHDDTHESVAVKVIDMKMLKNQINRQLLNSEIEILKELKSSENILNLHDIFTTKNNTYIVTQLCVSDLGKIIKNNLKETQVCQYMANIIAGYVEIWKKSIVHRDLKPANILITEDNKLKIADFGFAVKIEELQKNSKYNVGSPLYMAPESLKRNQYSFKSDIWSLGIIFYEMMFNDTPWKAKNQKELLKKIETQTIESILVSKRMNNVAKKFLIGTLNTSKTNRMNPENLENFSFIENSNILTQKILNSPLNHPFRKNESISINSPSYNYMKNIQFTKSLQKNGLNNSKLKNKLITNQSAQLKSIDIKQFNENQGFTKRNQENNQNSQLMMKENKRILSKILISEVHFCRFLFKLIQKMKESEKSGLLADKCGEELTGVYKNFTGIIRQKIQNLLNFKNINFLKCDNYKEYKMTTDYDKILKISKQYNERYKIQLNKYWSEPCNISSDSTNKMIISLYDTLRKQVIQMNNPEEQITTISQEVVILDYLITARQLIEMIKNNPNNYEKFAKKSRIQEIVEGKTVQIDYSLYTQIMLRVKDIMSKQNQPSYNQENNLYANQKYQLVS